MGAEGLSAVGGGREGRRGRAGVQAADLPFPFSPHFPFARVGRVSPLLPHSPIPSPILTRNSFGACLLPTPRPPPVCVSLSRSASDGVLLGLLFTPCQQLHIMHKWNGYSCIRYSPLFSLMPVLPHFSSLDVFHMPCQHIVIPPDAAPHRFRPRRSEKLSST